MLEKLLTILVYDKNIIKQIVLLLLLLLLLLVWCHPVTTGHLLTKKLKNKLGLMNQYRQKEVYYSLYYIYAELYNVA